MCHKASVGQSTTALGGSQAGPSHLFPLPRPELPWAPQPPGPCKEHHCMDTSSEDTNRNCPRPSHELQAQTPASVLLFPISGQQDLLTDLGRVPEPSSHSE